MRKLALFGAGFAIGVAAAEYLGWGWSADRPAWAALLPFLLIFAAALFLSWLGKKYPGHGSAGPVRYSAPVLWGLGCGLLRRLLADRFGPLYPEEALESLAAALRAPLAARLSPLLGEGDTRGLGLALLTGDRSEIGNTLRLALSLSGLSHITAISGMHISTLTGAVLALSPGPRARRWLIPFALVLAFGYAALTGFAASALRACLMCVLALSAELLRRENDPLTSLSAALTVLLLLDPAGIRSVGLLLSFSATLGILLLNERSEDWLEEQVYPLPFLRVLVRVIPEPVLRLVSGTVTASLAATLFTLPLTALFFGTVPTLNLITSLLTLPLLTPLLVCGLLTTLLAFLPFSLPANLLAAPLRWGLTWVAWVARNTAKLPFCALDARRPETVAALILFYLLLGFWLLLRRNERRSWPVPIALALVLPICIGVTRLQDAPYCARIIDVGQGAATCVTAEGHSVLIDCGGDGYGGAGCHTAQLLLTGGVHHLDAVVVTHCHADHIGGLSELREFLTVDHYYLPSGPESEELQRELASTGAEIVLVKEGESFTADGLTVRLCRPLPFAYDNNSCIGAEVSYGETNLLVTGDLPALAEQRFAAELGLSSCDILVAGHHGAADASGDVYLHRVNPTYVAISCGKYNRYGHPAPETLSRLEGVGCTILRTDRSGDLFFRLRRGTLRTDTYSN